jgi:hypothetical protein
MTEKSVKLVSGLPCHDDSDESSDESHEEQCQGEPRDTPTKPREEEETSIEKPAKKESFVLTNDILLRSTYILLSRLCDSRA